MVEKPKKHAEKKPKKFNWNTLWIFLAMIIWAGSSTIVSQLVIGFPILWIVGKDTFNTTICTTIYSILSYSLALFLVIYVPAKFFKKLKTNREELGLKDLPTWTDIGLSVVGFIASIILGALLVYVFEAFPWFNADEAQDIGFSTYLPGIERILAFFAIAVVAPIAEEIIYRGWLYGKLRAKLSMPLATFLVSLIFAIGHLQWNVGVNVFALSVVLCGLREITGTIYSGIIVHMIKNGLAFYLVYVLNIA